MCLFSIKKLILYTVQREINSNNETSGPIGWDALCHIYIKTKCSDLIQYNIFSVNHIKCS